MYLKRRWPHLDVPQLLAARHDVAEMAELIGADSLAFISIDGLYRALGEAKRNSINPHFCDACFTGDYPIPLHNLDVRGERQLALVPKAG